MAQVDLIHSNFTKGEVTDKLRVRSDIQTYYNSLARLENFLLMTYGGITRSPGTRYVGTVKDQTKKVRLVPFKFDVKQSYMLEFGHLYIRFYRDGGQIQSGGTAVEVVTPYTEADLPGLQFAQSADVLYIVHNSYEPRELIRLSHTKWYLKKTIFNPPPTHEADVDLNLYESPPGTRTLTPSATTGTGVTFTASGTGTVFLAGDVSRYIIYQDVNNPSIFSRAKITGIAPLVVTADILDAFPNTSAIPAGKWLLRGSPRGFGTCKRNGPVGSTTEFTVYADETELGGLSVFRSGTTEVGRYIKIWGGILKITGYLFPYRVNVTIISELDAPATNGIVADTFRGLWTLEIESWSSTLKYPKAITFFEGRQFVGNSSAFPFRLWGSKSNDFGNFGIGYLDDDGVQWDLLSGQVNTIEWLSFTNTLFAGCFGSEIRVDGAGKPLTPSNFQVKPDTEHGSLAIQPLRPQNGLIFVQRDGKRLREVSYNFDADVFEAKDLTLLSDHIVGSGIKEIAYQQEPNSLIWVVTKDGHIACMAYEKAEEIFGWSRRTTGKLSSNDTGFLASPIFTAYFENIAVIPHPSSDKDQVWVVVKRKINGSWQRYIEYFDDDGVYYNQLNTDCSLTFGYSVFYGDGTTTAFVASFDIQASADVEVYVDGVLKTITTDYTINTGTDTITFVTIPADRSKIQFFNKRKVTSLNTNLGLSFNQIDIRNRTISGSVHSVAIKTDGTLWAWGNNSFGQLGLGDITDRLIPTQVGTDINWAKIATGGNFTVAIKTDGTLWAWGENGSGQLGDGTIVQKNSPIQIGTGTNWSYIATGDGHTIGVKTDGTLWAWGENQNGQIGNNDTVDVLSPIQIGTDTWLQVAAVGRHSIGIKTNGTLWTWGYNFQGALGLNDTTDRLVPTQVGTATNWAKVLSSGVLNLHSLAIKTDGTLWAWGANGSGQLGLNDTTDRLVPVQVGTGTNWHDVVAGQNYSFGIKTDGTLWAWGNNGADFRLGLGDTTNRLVPTQIGTDTNWLKVSIPGAIKGNGILWAWGNNANGRLGLGDTVHRSVPTQVGTDTNWTLVISPLEGETVDIVGDGSAQAQKVVTNGIVTLDTAASKIEIGLPYTSTLETLEPEIPNNTLFGRTRRWKELWFHLKDSISMTIGNAPTRDDKSTTTRSRGEGFGFVSTVRYVPEKKEINFTEGWHDMDKPPPLFSGKKKWNLTGWESEGRFVIEQNKPYPLTILGYTGRLDIGD